MKKSLHIFYLMAVYIELVFVCCFMMSDAV